MTAPFDIDPKNEIWTGDEMKLRYEGGWSVEYSAAVMGSLGFNLWNICSLTNLLTIGTNPAPPNFNFGSCKLIWQRYGTVDLIVETDNDLDWRDRWVLFIGTIGNDSGVDESYGSSRTNMQRMNSADGRDNNAGANPMVKALGLNSDTCLAMKYTGVGRSTLALGGTNAGMLLRSLDVPDSVSRAIVMDAQFTTGKLISKLERPDPMTNAVTLAGLIFFTPQLGQMDNV